MADFQKFFNISHDLFCVLDRNDYYKQVNPAFCRLLHYPEEKLKSQPFTYFIHPEDLEDTVREYEKVKEGKRNNIIANRFRSSDGAYHWISWSTIVADPGADLYASGQNISAQKQMQEAHKKAQEENKRRVSKAIIQTQENERSKISLELHDNVNQVLTTVKLLMEVSQDHPEVAKTSLQRGVALQQDAINGIRNISKNLSVPTLANLRLTDSVRDLVNDYSLKDHFTVSVVLNEVDGVYVEQFIHLALYRILQEQLTNITKHAKAKNVKITLGLVKGSLSMEVTDDGQGFDPIKKSSGIGIQNMNARVESLNGSFSLISEPGRGTSLQVSVPLD